MVSAGSINSSEDADSGAPVRATSDLLGISVAELDATSRKQLGLKAGEGIRVTRVNGESAIEAGLTPGIVILQVGRESVGSVAEFNGELRKIRPGQAVMLLVRSPRGGTAFVAVRSVDDHKSGK
jgi:serine protease Do